jgi:formylglycine-generating enzyme required for sulfatase activity
MPRLQALLECVGQALCEKGQKALRRQWPYADLLLDIAKAAYDNAHRKLPGADLRLALADLAACPSHEYDRRLGELIADLSQTHSVPKEALADYLRAFPPTVRLVFRRPSDPDGHTAPENLVFYKVDEFLRFLPPRAPRFKPGDHPEGLDGWVLTELRGLGECSEVWRAEDPNRPDEPSVALKFAIDPETRDLVKSGADLFKKTFGLNEIAGILPLNSVYLESDPPCLESPFVYGYDLTGLIFDWKWRYEHAKPDPALKLIRRLTGIIAEAHAKGVVHRDLKPSNVILHPTEGGKFTMWVSDFGWGQIVAGRSLDLAKLGARGEMQRLAYRGAATALYASPQQAKKEPPTQPDDVHALGVIWYQLLKRDPTAAAPVGTEWVEEFRPHGFTDSQARLLQSCLATRPDKRPRTAAHLVEQFGQVTVGTGSKDGSNGSKQFSLKSPSSTTHTPVNTTSRGKSFDAEAAASQAAAMLAAAGGGPITSGGPLSTSGFRLVKNSIGMTFARIPAGTFTMGSTDKEHGHREHEGPPHEIRISRAFYLAVTPVTQAQYLHVMGKNPAKYSKSRGGGNEHPVETVHWKEAESFCIRLAQLGDEEVQRRSYRLPTEAEWEYACRAGTKTAFSSGEKLTPHDGIFAGTGGKYGGKSTAPVGITPPNSFGLTDMHGNVQEWVHDWYDEYYYFESPAEDPNGPGRGVLRIARGGCWNMLPTDCRSASRRPYPPDTHSDTIGFRVVMVVA